MTTSLRSRLILGMFMGLAVLLVAAGAMIYTAQRRQLYRAFDDTLLSSANSLTLLIHPGPFGSWFDCGGLARLPAGQIRQGALFQFWSERPIDVLPPFQVSDFGQPGPGPTPPFPDGPPPPGRLPEPPPAPRPPAELQEWLADAPVEHGLDERVVRSRSLNGADLPRLETSLGRPRVEEIILPNGLRGRAIGVQFQLPFFPPGPGPGEASSSRLTIVVAASTAEVEKQLSFLAALLAVTALGTLVVAGGVAWLVVSRGLHPLAMVARKIATLDETDLKERIADRGVPREIEPVVHQLNGLLGRLDEAFERERALTADVAHELRTPVAEIRAIAEITLSRSRDPEEYRQALRETLDTIKTLQGLIEKLLVLARLEAGQMEPELTRIPLQPLVTQLWAQVRQTATARGIAFEDRCPPEALVLADPKLLEVVLSNVLSNAAAYTPDGGRITAEAHRVGTLCQLSITNNGCELSKGEVAHVFDRFWRADAARSKSGLNCGLGLALVRRAMEAMGGRADATLDKEHRFTLTLTFAATERRG